MSWKREYIVRSHCQLTSLVCSMAVGLGMTDEEFEQLKTQVDDSFWVMRVIGLLWALLYLTLCSAVPP